MGIFKVRFDVAGGHVHCALFYAKALDQTYAKCGDFCVRCGEEFTDLYEDFDCDFEPKDENSTLATAMAP